MTPDVNVLLAASRTDHPQHAIARAWLDEAISACGEGGGIELLPMVTCGLLRLATNSRVFKVPTPIGSAIQFLDSLSAIPGVEIVEVGREWPTLKSLARSHGVVGNGITDAWIAATVRTIGSHLVTFDRDFRRLLDRSEVTVLSTRP